MQRYDYELYTKSKKHSTNDIRYSIFDRIRGHHNKLATVYDVAVAEAIVRALNREDPPHEANISYHGIHNE